MEIKTSKQIIYDNCYEEDNILKFYKSKINKKWVSVESLLKFLDKMEQDYKDINQHNDYVKRVIYDIKQKLKGEQE